jgi:hypothetical protein
VSYSVLIQNTGNLAGTLNTIADELPAGFEFVSMLPASDIDDAPLGSTGTVYWHGAWTLDPGEDLRLAYQLQSGGAGTKVNTVTAYDDGGNVVGKTSATVVLLGGLPYEENFDNDPPASWQPFLNWPGLSAERWYAAGGVYNYDWAAVLPGNTSYDLSIYNDPGAQSWTDYRIETRMKDVKEENLDRGLTGIWFRGTYQDSGAMDGRLVSGYYFYMKPPDNTLYLMKTNPTQLTFYSQQVVDSFYYPPRIGRKHWYDVTIEVRGSNIQIWFGDDEEGMIKVFDWTDPSNAYPAGTVGFATYFTAARYDFIRVEPLN